MTLVELMISVALMSVVATIFTTVLWSVQQGVATQQLRSQANDQSRAAIQQLDREIRSGNMLYDPAFEAAGACAGYNCAPGYSLRVYTQANATTRIPPNQCVHYVLDEGKLLRRAWAPGSGTTIDGWRVIAEDIVNRDLSVPAFAMDPTPGGKVVGITLMVNPALGQADAPTTTRVETSIAIRNSATGNPCSPMPAS